MNVWILLFCCGMMSGCAILSLPFKAVEGVLKIVDALPFPKPPPWIFF